MRGRCDDSIQNFKFYCDEKICAQTMKLSAETYTFDAQSIGFSKYVPNMQYMEREIRNHVSEPFRTGKCSAVTSSCTIDGNVCANAAQMITKNLSEFQYRNLGACFLTTPTEL